MGDKPLSADLLGRASDILRVLAHPRRLKMVEILLRKPISVGELARRMNMAPAAVSGHLNNMRAHGIVASRREGKQVFYEVTSPQASYLIECIRRHRREI